MKTLVLLILCSFAASCAPTHAYAAADRATFDAIAPEYLAYVAADESLDEASKVRRQTTVLTWKLRLEAAEAAK